MSVRCACHSASVPRRCCLTLLSGSLLLHATVVTLDLASPPPQAFFLVPFSLLFPLFISPPLPSPFLTRLVPCRLQLRTPWCRLGVVWKRWSCLTRHRRRHRRPCWRPSAGGGGARQSRTGILRWETAHLMWWWWVSAAVGLAAGVGAAAVAAAAWGAPPRLPHRQPVGRGSFVAGGRVGVGI